ncbi:hypothetical protein V8C42DRAFT_342578 [Trichoderma barbatum]
MVNMQNWPTSLALLVSSLLFASSSSALHIRAHQADVLPTPVAHLPNAVAAAVITPGPSLDSVGDLRLARALSIPACATSCVASAVTKSTNCKLGDTVCECNSMIFINSVAAPCVQSACGFVGAAQAQVAGEQICISVLAGILPSTPTRNNNVPGQTAGSSNGSPSPSGGSNGGSNGGGSNGSTHRPGNRLSGGAIAGIVVGVVVGFAAVAAAIWKFCVSKAKGGNTPAAGVDAAAAPAIAPVQIEQVSLIDPVKPSVSPQTVSSISPFQGSTATTPPVYTDAAELPTGSYPQPPASYAYPPHPMGQAYHEVHVQPPEMAGNTHLPQELYGGGPVYEMGTH